MDPGQDDLPEAAAGQVPDRRRRVLRADAPAAPAHAGDDAVGTTAVAAVLDLQIAAGPERGSPVDIVAEIRVRLLSRRSRRLRGRPQPVERPVSYTHLTLPTNREV